MAPRAVVPVPLPDGVTAIRTVDEPMVGAHLEIVFANGHTLRVDALALTEHECGVVVTDQGEEIILSASFGGPAPEIHL